MTFGHLRKFPLVPLLLFVLVFFGVSVRADDDLAQAIVIVPKPDISGHLPEAAAAPLPKAAEPAKVSAVMKKSTASSASSYPIHSAISTTWFYVGEPSDADNDYIPNDVSAWDDSWQTHFGGVDDPKNRNGYFPAAFTPHENPFYFALPYNDLANNGSHKSSASLIPWFGSHSWGIDQSALKNRWIKISKSGRVAYAQWEDVGPNGEDDASYVFGSTKPVNTFGAHAGLDVSPAVKDFLKLSDVDSTSWQFVDDSQVPGGPWRQVITTSGVSYK